jgi:hypothetical protein
VVPGGETTVSFTGAGVGGAERRSGPPSPATATRPGASGPPRHRPRQATGGRRCGGTGGGLRQVEAAATCEQSPYNASRPALRAAAAGGRPRAGTHLTFGIPNFRAVFTKTSNAAYEWIYP